MGTVTEDQAQAWPAVDYELRPTLDQVLAAFANGVCSSTFHSRIAQGWDMDRAIYTPARTYTCRRRTRLFPRAEAAPAEFIDFWFFAAGEQKLEVIKEVSALLGWSLKEAKHLVETPPWCITLHRGVAERMKARLATAGAVVELRSAHANATAA